MILSDVCTLYARDCAVSLSRRRRRRFVGFIAIIFFMTSLVDGAAQFSSHQCENDRLPFTQRTETTRSHEVDASPTSWTEGPKRVLFMRVNFTDDRSEPISETQAANMMMAVSNYFFEVSYGKTSLSTTFTPVLQLPNPRNYYAPFD